VSQSSWIVDVRERLATPPPVALATEGARHAVVVPLFVDGGELWLLLRGSSGDELVPGAATLPQSPIAAGEEPWPAAQRAAAAFGVDAAVLPLGMLDHLPDPSGDVVVPCVAAVRAPARENGPPAATTALVRLPLRAARSPSLLEERRAVVRGVETWVTVGHFGPVKLAGAEVEIVELLLERMFRGGAL
jgi:hypothetical protein